MNRKDEKTGTGVSSQDTNLKIILLRARVYVSVYNKNRPIPINLLLLMPLVSEQYESMNFRNIKKERDKFPRYDYALPLISIICITVFRI